MTDIFEAMGNVDKRPYIEGKGWGPGGYTCKCWTCGESFMGEKRASECAPCAYGDDDSGSQGE